MPTTKNPKMKGYPNIERRFRIGAAKKKKKVYFKCPLEMDLGLCVQGVVMHQPQFLFL